MTRPDRCKCVCVISRCVAACSEPLEVPGSFVPVEDELGEADQGVSLGGRLQTADLTRGLVAVMLGEETRLLHTIALRRRNKNTHRENENTF